jgi:hypothetical protein
LPPITSGLWVMRLNSLIAEIRCLAIVRRMTPI